MDYQKVSSLAKRRGFFQPASEPYGGLAGFFDYGPVGVKFRERILRVWKRHYVLGLGCLELDGALVGPEDLFKASGHLSEFDDPLVECKECSKNYRADQLVEGGDGMAREELAEVLKSTLCPSCEGVLSELSAFNLMFATQVGAGRGTKGYLRPETAQSIFQCFPWLYRLNRNKMPLAVSQIGRSYRNEISPRQGLLRMREFTQMEVEHFFLPKDEPSVPTHLGKISLVLVPNEGEVLEIDIESAVKKGVIGSALVGTHLAAAQAFLQSVGIPKESLRWRQHRKDEMAHYSQDCWDGEIKTSIGWIEVVGVAHRGDYDLQSHGTSSGNEFRVPIPGTSKSVERWCLNVGALGKAFQSKAGEIQKSVSEMELTPGMKVVLDGEEISLGEEFFKKETNQESEMVYPCVVEPSFGLDRLFYSILETTWKEDGERQWLSLPRVVSPYDVLVAPLMTKDGLAEKAKDVCNVLLENGIDVFYDESGSIGRRYARADEIGIFFSMTIDHQTLEDGTVTLRERDSKNQSRVSIDDALSKLG